MLRCHALNGASLARAFIAARFPSYPPSKTNANIRRSDVAPGHRRGSRTSWLDGPAGDQAAAELAAAASAQQTGCGVGPGSQSADPALKN